MRPGGLPVIRRVRHSSSWVTAYQSILPFVTVLLDFCSFAAYFYCMIETITYNGVVEQVVSIATNEVGNTVYTTELGNVYEIDF